MRKPIQLGIRRQNIDWTRTILRILIGSTAIVAVVALPGLGVALRLFEKQTRTKNVLPRALARMERTGLVIMRGKKGVQSITLTEKGAREARFADLELPSLARKEFRAWFAVSFDIPEAKRSARRALSRKLQEIGFYQFQRSVYVYPLPCREEIDFIRSYFGVEPYVTYYSVAAFEPDEEKDIRSHFSKNF